MDNVKTNAGKAIILSEKILENACFSVIVNMRFLEGALFTLKFTPSSAALATDGQNLFYNPAVLLKHYANEPNSVTKALLHTVLHCIFRHIFVGAGIDRLYWNVACDMAVEDLVSGFDLSCLTTQKGPRAAAALLPFKENIRPFTAEKIYRYLLDNVSPEDIRSLEETFHTDDHSLWYAALYEDEEQVSDDGYGVSAPRAEELEKEWESISRHIQVDLDTFSKKHGSRSGGLDLALQTLNRETYDYRAFLKKFAVLGETLKINDDEFDYIYYTYGLSLYKNMPLTEPLEYKEEKRIKEFVIALDTSGSVSGGLVQKFLQKTYNIFMESESFFTKINLYIIQCDSSVKDAAHITCKEDFDSYIKNISLTGGGGTDFRPVFEYVQTLDFINLKGLIYFTDGYGTFPKNKPSYDTAFVFLRGEGESPAVPPWAIKLVLDDANIFSDF